jgi:hypothetical protein
VTVLPADMPLHPGPWGFNEGFVGLAVSEPIAALTFTPNSVAFVIDDLHIGVPEPSTFALLAFGVFGLAYFLRQRGTQLPINQKSHHDLAHSLRRAILFRRLLSAARSRTTAADHSGFNSRRGAAHFVQLRKLRIRRGGTTRSLDDSFPSRRGGTSWRRHR